MSKLNNRSADLSLLPALRALLEERSVTRAAERAGMSQPSMSRALARLRRLFGDQLLVRGPSGSMLTARAVILAAELPAVLDDMERLVRPPKFDPATAIGRFVIVTPDYVSLVLLPAVLRRVRREAPGIAIDIRSVASIDGYEALATTVDLVIGVVESGAGGLYHQRLFDDGFACLLPRSRARRGKPLTLDEYVAIPHAIITITGRGGGAVDAALERLGRPRRIALRIQSFLAVAWVIADSDVAVTLPRLVAEHTAPLVGLTVADVPLDLGTFTMTQIWHARRHKDPAHAWLREIVAAEARPLDRAKPERRRRPARPQRGSLA